MAHHFEFRLTDAGRAMLADGANRGIKAVRFTKVSVGSGAGPGGAADDARRALRNQRGEAALAGTTEVAGELAFAATIVPSADYKIREVGLWGKPGDTGAEALYAFWTHPSEVFDRAVTGTTTVVAGALSVAPAAAGVTVTPDTKIILESQGLLPAWLLPGPHAATADMRIVVGAHAAAQGGSVSVARAQKLSLGQPSAAGDTAFSRVFETAGWASADLDANKTYFLRAQAAEDGSLRLYVAKGAIGDAAPESLRGTPDAAAGGGFASTPLDARIAKIETRAPGSVPSVSRYALDARPRPGIAAWSAAEDYPHPSAAWGSDDALYASKRASGPSHGGAADPAKDADRSHWRPALLTAGLSEIAAPKKNDMVRVGVRAGAAPGVDGWVEIQKLPGALAPAGGVVANRKYTLKALAGGAFELALALAPLALMGSAVTERLTGSAPIESGNLLTLRTPPGRHRVIAGLQISYVAYSARVRIYKRPASGGAWALEVDQRARAQGNDFAMAEFNEDVETEFAVRCLARTTSGRRVTYGPAGFLCAIEVFA